MNKLIALIAAGIIMSLPVIANAGAAACPDFTGDAAVTTADILFVVDHYQQDKGDGTVFSITDILSTVQHYGESCS